ncbi:type II toxin-antitoxin system RelE/ParE family toxin [Pseudoduganella eburnea]|uniref:Type II toxin-antitoxin system RelE/ParE family toxin n=1 Tax=Massilia eburnea TaxID=1776165 RepID=A0A6L6QHU0_9BURK|nr:type II toxin-antitoxin system RelE/ParE family toxin [Massilia eburnea]MTW11721.1 type II toxin-antitoxin system RelE/ParE family toxin [Massilia eburnea]
MKYFFVAAAEDELRQAHNFYAKHTGHVISEAFAQEAKRIVELIAANPKLGTSLGPRFRAYPLRNFPFKIIYQILPDHVRVMAIAHTSRRPGFWRSRG